MERSHSQKKGKKTCVVRIADDEKISCKATQHSVHPTGGSLRVFRQFSWLKVGSIKMALPRPAHQRVTQAVGRLLISVLCKMKSIKRKLTADHE